ncbi:hypothetical protein TOTORO_00790 [Serratia phage vB_SmaS-Totoro]|nr:hypothetical protein TOTORO_00790 [Serratia phage vB_SmaS-Totoro]
MIELIVVMLVVLVVAVYQTFVVPGSDFDLKVQKYAELTFLAIAVSISALIVVPLTMIAKLINKVFGTSIPV